MDTPFSTSYGETTDRQLVDAAVQSDKSALEALIVRHQTYIYNVALKMVLSPADAEDLTQEVLIKVITKLNQYQQQASFRTWLYRIVLNHFLTMKSRRMENYVFSFDRYGQELDAIPNETLNAHERLEMKEAVEDAKIGCMAGMLMCLDRKQRLTYVLGEIFRVDHRLGGELLEISSDNFRQQLSRARRDLYQFMQKKCGLVNRNNPCRCHKKTKGFIRAGWVNADSLQFNRYYRQRIAEVVPDKNRMLDQTLKAQYGNLFRQHPFQEKDNLSALQKSVLKNRTIQDIFNFQ